MKTEINPLMATIIIVIVALIVGGVIYFKVTTQSAVTTPPSVSGPLMPGGFPQRPIPGANGPGRPLGPQAPPTAPPAAPSNQ